MKTDKSAIVKTEKAALEKYFEAALPKLQEVAPQWCNVKRVLRLVMAARTQNPQIAQCSKESLLMWMLRAAESGFDQVGPGGAWIVPFRNKYTRQLEAQFIPDYRGLMSLALKTGAVDSIEAQVVYEHDTIEVQMGSAPSIRHVPALSDRGGVTGAYCIVRKGESVHVEYMSREQIESIRARSKARDNGPWNTDYDRMALKTVVRRALAPFIGTSQQLGAAIAADEELDLDADKSSDLFPSVEIIEEKTEQPDAEQKQ